MLGPPRNPYPVPQQASWDTASRDTGYVSGGDYSKGYISATHAPQPAVSHTPPPTKQELTQALLAAQTDELQAVLEHQALPGGIPPEPKGIGHDDITQWGRPPGTMGDGMTLLEDTVRRRFNDALSSTPLGGRAEWTYGRRNFVFMPNSEIYQAHQSGGQCRDAILVTYETRTDEKQVRGLFCRLGPGADWLLQK